MRAISTLLVLSVFAIVLAVVGRLFWERYFHGLRPPVARWAKVYRLASWAGIAPPLYLTPVEAAERLGATLSEIAAMRGIARAYTRERYGRPTAEVQDEDEQTQRIADRDYRRVRDQLVRSIVSRLFHLGRVPGEVLARRYAAAGAAGR